MVGTPRRSSSPAVAPAPVLFGQPGPLPALATMNARDRYRQRPEDELEEATWHTAAPDAIDPDAAPILADPAPVRLRSIHSKQASVIRFANKSQRAVRALWVDFDGNEIAYSVVEPGTTRLYRTYVSHPWIVRELTTGARMMVSGAPAVVGLAEEQTVDITDPPMLTWGLNTHTCFPEDFKTSTRQLLIAHHRLAKAEAVPAAAPRPQLLLPVTPPCSPCIAAKAAADTTTAAYAPTSTSTTTTTTRLQLSTPQTQLSIAITTDGPDCCGPAGAAAPNCPASPLLSPRRTINITVNATGASLGVNIESHMLPTIEDSDVTSPGAGADQGRSPSLRPPQSPASRSRRALISGLKSSLSTIKGLVSPRRAGCLRRSLVGASGSRAASPFEIALQTEQALAPAVLATNLGALPSHLIVRIVELAAPVQWQGTHMPPAGRPDVSPVMLACHPATKTQREEEEELAAAQAALAAQQPQAQQQAVNEPEVPAAPLNAAVAALNAFIQHGFQMWGGPLAQGAVGQGQQLDDGPNNNEDMPGLMNETDSDEEEQH